MEDNHSYYWGIVMIGARIKHLRKGRNLSQTMLGKYIGISQTTVTAWEKNRPEPSSTYVTKLAELFEVSTDYLLDHERSIRQPVTVDLADENVNLTYRGRPLSKNDRNIIYQLMED